MADRWQEELCEAHERKEAVARCVQREVRHVTPASHTADAGCVPNLRRASVRNTCHVRWAALGGLAAFATAAMAARQPTFGCPIANAAAASLPWQPMAADVRWLRLQKLWACKCSSYRDRTQAHPSVFVSAPFGSPVKEEHGPATFQSTPDLCAGARAAEARATGANMKGVRIPQQKGNETSGRPMMRKKAARGSPLVPRRAR